jgi:alkaline phosphatase D
MNLRRSWRPMRLVATTIPILLLSFSGTHSNDAGTATTGMEDDTGRYLLTFQHGVASFDPTPHAVILWTRVTGTAGQIASVTWALGTDPDFLSPLEEQAQVSTSTGTATTTADQDYTIRVDVTGLNPYTFYYYKFTYCHSSTCVDSATGRTKTAPSVQVPTSRAHNDTSNDNGNGNIFPQLRFATVSCSSLQYGWFHAYDQIYHRDDVDAVIHLGDYIYEHAPRTNHGDIRDHQPPTAAVTLSDYRIRYAQYRRDVSLQKLHQRYPFIMTWDDHEFVNDSWQHGSPEHDKNTQGDFASRKAAAATAYQEWLPFRERPTESTTQLEHDEYYEDSGNMTRDDNDNDSETADPPGLYNIYRKLPYGNLADLFVLDTRVLARDQQRGVFGGGQAMFLPNYYDTTNHDMLGPTQMAWIKTELQQSTARWKVLVQPVLMSPVSLLGLFAHNADAWDGYQADRAELLDHIADNHIDNVVILTGDVHITLISDVPREKTADLQTWWDWLVRFPRKWLPGAKYTSIAVEFAVTSVTSATTFEDGFLGSIPFGLEFANLLFRTVGISLNPHGKYADILNKGYQVIDFQPQRVQADLYITGSPKEQIDDLHDEKRYQGSYFSLDGGNAVRVGNQESTPLNGGYGYGTT